MKNISVFLLCILIIINTSAQTINVSTGIDNAGNALANGSSDPNWVISSASVSPKVSQYYSPYWEVAPVSSTNAKWVNFFGIYNSGNPTNTHTFERSFRVSSCLTKLIYNLKIAYDDDFVSLEMIPPSGSPIPLSVSPGSSYRLSNTIIGSLNNPSIGTWKIRAKIKFLDAAAAFLLSGNINLEPCTSYSPNCCNNTFGFVTPTPTPPYYAGDGFTYSLEDFNVTTANNVPLTEIKASVTSLEYISKYEDCKKCNIKQIFLGSIIGWGNIGTGVNSLVLQQVNGSSLDVNTTYNEVIWQNPNGATLTTQNKFTLMYLLPSANDIPCCVDSVKICTKITYRDVNCGFCEIFNCSTVPLTNEVRENIRNANNGRGKIMKSEAPLKIDEILQKSLPGTPVRGGSTHVPPPTINDKSIISCPTGYTMVQGKCIPDVIINAPWLDMKTGQIKYFEYKEDMVLDNPEICAFLGVKELTIKKGRYEIDRSNLKEGAACRLPVVIKVKLPTGRLPILSRKFEGTNPKGMDCKTYGNSCFWATETNGPEKVMFSITPIIKNGAIVALQLAYPPDASGKGNGQPKKAGF